LRYRTTKAGSTGKKSLGSVPRDCTSRMQDAMWQPSRPHYYGTQRPESGVVCPLISSGWRFRIRLVLPTFFVSSGASRHGCTHASCFRTRRTGSHCVASMSSVGTTGEVSITHSFHDVGRPPAKPRIFVVTRRHNRLRPAARNTRISIRPSLGPVSPPQQDVLVGKRTSVWKEYVMGRRNVAHEEGRCVPPDKAICISAS
jgi:hypothetical protein